MVIQESINSYIQKELKKLNKNIKNVSDDMITIGNQDTFVDAGSLSASSDRTYAKKFIELCKGLSKYQNKIILVNLNEWCNASNGKNITSSGRLGALLSYMKSNPELVRKDLAGFTFIFVNSDNEGIALEMDKFAPSQINTLNTGINTLVKTEKKKKDKPEEKKKPADPVKASNENKKNNLTTPDLSEQEKKLKEEKKEKLVAAISNAAENADSDEELLEIIDSDEDIAKLLTELEEDEGPKVSKARMNRMNKLNTDFSNSTVNGRSVKEMLEEDEKEIPTTSYKVHSINEEWEDMTFVNFEKAYDLDADIIKILTSFSEKKYPISVISCKVDDTSTSMDHLYTYTAKMEDCFGKRFTLTFDIPKFKNDRFMVLRGNEKVMNGQLMLLPCTKSDDDTVQLVSNYKKIFIRKFGVLGRSSSASDRLIKALRKVEDSKLKIYFGDNSKICNKYELPIDYIDLASNVNRIETKDRIYYFDQDVYIKNFNYEAGKGIPYAINRSGNSIVYFNPVEDASEEFDPNTSVTTISYVIGEELKEASPALKEIYDKTKPANKLNYARCSIMAAQIPAAVLLGYHLGINALMDNVAGKGKWKIYDKKSRYDPDKVSIIRAKDCYIAYKPKYENSIILNGLKECDTSAYTFQELNKRTTWLDFLDNFGGRLLSDGLDNFYELFLDPITKEVCEHLGMKNCDYISLIIYGSNLLADNAYIKHTNINGNRYRSNEIVAGYLYNCLAKSYSDYFIGIKHGRKQPMAMKRTAVIDAIMADPTSSDLSILNPLLEIEAANTVSFKGLSGMNSDRAYSLDKRTYDESMEGKLALSTGFATNVGINRQSTINMQVEGERGYIKPTKEDDTSITNNFSMTEAITPFGTTSDDPFRSAMTFIQTSKHGMRTAKSAPLLISNGADEAMPYMSSDTYCIKALANGKVVELTPEYMIIEYNKEVIVDKTTVTKQYVDLKEEVKKNSDGGFFVTIKLDTDLKLNSKFKAGDIIAYDRASYSNKSGEANFLAYNVGVLSKVVIMNTDEGYEDSTAVSEWMSEAMASDIVTCKSIVLDKATNIYEVKKVGESIQEGDPLLIMQNAFEEDDANELLKNITDEDIVSDLGRIRLKSGYTGVVQDIKIYRTCEINEMSDSLAKLVKDYEKAIKAKKKIYIDNGLPGAQELDPDYKMKPEGKLKGVFDGVLIEFYIKYHDKLSVGDKLVAQSANKGVIRGIFPKGQEPYSEYRPEEKIHAMLAARSFNARMVTSVWKSGAINKCLIELDRSIKDIMGFKAKPLEDYQ